MNESLSATSNHHQILFTNTRDIASIPVALLSPLSIFATLEIKRQKKQRHGNKAAWPQKTPAHSFAPLAKSVA
jgi:hypothetical protein